MLRIRCCRRSQQQTRCATVVLWALLLLLLLSLSVRHATGTQDVAGGAGNVEIGGGRGLRTHVDDDDAHGDDATTTTTTSLLAFDSDVNTDPSSSSSSSSGIVGIVVDNHDDDDDESRTGGDDDDDDDNNNNNNNVVDDNNNSPSQGIVGGVPTNGQADAPFFVRGEYGCGAALIAPEVVLGAAHCAAFYGSKVMVGAYQRGSTSGGLAVTRSITSDLKIHPSYQSNGNSAPSYDMLLFKIQSVQSYPNLRPVVLNSDAASGTSPGTVLTMIGFGYTNWNESESSVLLKANVTAISNAECESRYGRKSGFFDASVTCTIAGMNATSGGSGSAGAAATSCFGDSGGPLVDATTGKLVGIISFGTEYCDPKYPSGSMNVATALPWIVDTACKLTDVQLPYCPTRTAPPTRAPVLPPPPPPVPAPAPAPTKPGSPTKPRSPSGVGTTASTNCVTVERCASIVQQECDCPTISAPKTRCFKRAVKRKCCSVASQIRTSYFLQSQLEYRTTVCGLAS